MQLLQASENDEKRKQRKKRIHLRGNCIIARGVISKSHCTTQSFLSGGERRNLQHGKAERRRGGGAEVKRAERGRIENTRGGEGGRAVNGGGRDLAQSLRREFLISCKMRFFATIQIFRARRKVVF